MLTSECDSPTPPKLEASTNTSCVGSVVSPSNAPSKRASGHATTEGRVTKSRATPKAQPTTASDSDVPPAPGMVRGARGKWVYEKGSSKMTKAWITRRKNGTSGRRGGAPLADTVRKNKAKGVDYGSAVNA